VTRHYLDHASTSPPRPEAVAAMRGWLERTEAADPGRVHTEGRMARAVVEEARDAVGAFLGVRPRQVVFTSGGTEAINAAVYGATRGRPGAPVVVSDVEHSAVREASARAAPVERLPVDGQGRIDTDALVAVLARLEAAGAPAGLVHCQVANHEVGTLQPLADVVEAAHNRGAWVHADACAAAGHHPLDLEALGADLVSVSAHKLGGPPGMGALVVRRSLRIDPFVVGGDQERARRAGLENVLGIVGFAAAAHAIARDDNLATEADAARRRTDALVEAAETIDGIHVLGARHDRVPHIACLAVEGVEAEGVVLGLDQAGVAVHSGSSCSSESLAPSAVLQAMGADAERSLRVSVGWSTSDGDVEAFAEALPGVVARLRALQH
jgi:cysteine desulfurase